MTEQKLLEPVSSANIAHRVRVDYIDFDVSRNFFGVSNMFEQMFQHVSEVQRVYNIGLYGNVQFKNFYEPRNIYIFINILLHNIRPCRCMSILITRRSHTHVEIQAKNMREKFISYIDPAASIEPMHAFVIPVGEPMVDEFFWTFEFRHVYDFHSRLRHIYKIIMTYPQSVFIM